jgi:hypothetical protein
MNYPMIETLAHHCNNTNPDNTLLIAHRDARDYNESEYKQLFANYQYTANDVFQYCDDGGGVDSVICNTM